jgi:hypothetical protein
MGGGTQQKTSEDARVPSELSPLLKQTANSGAAFQVAAPLEPFLKASPMRTAPLSANEQRGISEAPGLFDLSKRKVTGENLKDSPSLSAAREAYTRTIQPRIENTAAVSGLGRSTALTNAMAQAEAEYMTPLIESELGREERGIAREGEMTLQGIQAALQSGGLERSIEQSEYGAEYEDQLRRQALAEQALFVPMGSLLPSTIGRGSKTSGKQGMFTELLMFLALPIISGALL